MNDNDVSGNRGATVKDIGYIPRCEATPETYNQLGFKCGLEIHQQLRTDRKLFCRCPAGLYQDDEDYDAQLIRHMRPTLSELGEYDGTALMEFRTKKNITYRIKGETACTYDIDDTPPFPLNRDALRIAVEISLLLGTKIVGELHITRKQYLDGSIPTGFQRTAIVGIDGEIGLPSKIVRIRQLSIEEDSCREVSDVGHERIYMTDRLGMPLIETVTEPELLTPDEAAEAAQHLRYLARSTGHVNTGIGAARQDVNVSIDGGTRVEIKGVQHITWIPELTHNEAYRQKALLIARDRLLERYTGETDWSPRFVILRDAPELGHGIPDGHALYGAVLPGFADLLPLFTAPGRSFADEVADRLKVIACVEKPNLKVIDPNSRERHEIPGIGPLDPADGLILFWAPLADVDTATETIDERCRLAFAGVPNETRKAMADGTTIFERVLPGPDRMYPDTDSAPIPISESWIEEIRSDLPRSIEDRRRDLESWHVPAHIRPYLLRRNLVDLLRWLVDDMHLSPAFGARLLGQDVRHVLGAADVDLSRIRWAVENAMTFDAPEDLMRSVVPLALIRPDASFADLLSSIGYVKQSPDEIRSRIPFLRESFSGEDKPMTAIRDFVIGCLRACAVGNVPMREVARMVEEAVE